MTKTNLTLAAALLAILAGAGVAVAREQGHGRDGGFPMDFSTLDADGSGEIDAADIDALRASRFAEFDTDGDGTVTEAEFIAHAQSRAGDRAAEMFARMDSDGDGVLSRDALEARGGRGPDFDRILSRADTDGSGGISEAEFDAMRDRMAEHRGRGEHGGKGGRQGWGRN